MSSMPILRFHRVDQLVHFFNLVCWLILIVSGLAIGNANRQGINPEHMYFGLHFISGFALTILVLSYFVLARSRAKRLFHEIFRTDRPFWTWLLKLGYYPQKCAKRIGLTCPHIQTIPQGRYHAGQKLAYGTLISMNFLLIATGLGLYFLHSPNQTSGIYNAMLAVHSLSFNISLLMLLIHIPMALTEPAYLKAIFPGTSGVVEQSVAQAHASLWVEEDLELKSMDKLKTPKNPNGLYLLEKTL